MKKLHETSILRSHVHLTLSSCSDRPLSAAIGREHGKNFRTHSHTQTLTQANPRDLLIEQLFFFVFRATMLRRDSGPEGPKNRISG